MAVGCGGKQPCVQRDEQKTLTSSLPTKSKASLPHSSPSLATKVPLNKCEMRSIASMVCPSDHGHSDLIQNGSTQRQGIWKQSTKGAELNKCTHRVGRHSARMYATKVRRSIGSGLRRKAAVRPKRSTKTFTSTPSTKSETSLPLSSPSLVHLRPQLDQP